MDADLVVYKIPEKKCCFDIRINLLLFAGGWAVFSSLFQVQSPARETNVYKKLTLFIVVHGLAVYIVMSCKARHVEEAIFKWLKEA